MGKKITIFIIALVLASTLHAAYSFRHDAADLYREWKNGPLPEGAAYELADEAEKAERERLLATITERASGEPESPPDDDVVAGVDEDDEPLPNEEVPANDPQNSKDAEIAALTSRRADIVDAFNLAVPFTPQAPHAIWDELHNEACEEASAIMVKAFLDGETELPPDVADARILELAAYEDATFGSNLDTDAEQTAQFMREHLGLLGARAVPISSMDDVRNYVATGSPVILPAYGKALGNPYFRGDGPLYHMVVVRGFKDDLIIVNDPGTRRGENYVYDAETLWNAVHDWNGGDVQNGRKVMIVAE